MRINMQKKGTSKGYMVKKELGGKKKKRKKSNYLVWAGIGKCLQCQWNFTISCWHYMLLWSHRFVPLPGNYSYPNHRAVFQWFPYPVKDISKYLLQVIIILILNFNSRNTKWVKTGRHYCWKIETEKHLQFPNMMQKQVQTGAWIILQRVTNFLIGPSQISPPVLKVKFDPPAS